MRQRFRNLGKIYGGLAGLCLRLAGIRLSMWKLGIIITARKRIYRANKVKNQNKIKKVK